MLVPGVQDPLAQDQPGKRTVSAGRSDLLGGGYAAADGAGLGHAFLRHVERCRLLLHVVDISAADGRDPLEDIDTIDTELEKYSPELSLRPQIVVANKIDSILEDEPIIEELKNYCEQLGRPLVFVSAVSGDGLEELVALAAKTLATLPPLTVYESEVTEEESIASTFGKKETVVEKRDGIYYVEGEWLYNLMGQVNFDDYESLNFFQRILIKNGVIDMLRAEGVQEGDTVSIYDFEFDFVY